MEELYMDAVIERLLGDYLRTRQRRRYAEAVAVAIVLRHSWSPDDLATTLQRLNGRAANLVRHTRKGR
jgi:hypothetical protein